MLLVHASSLYGDLLGLSFSDKTIQKSKKITMKGGFNKILRNIVAGSSDTEYEKVSFWSQMKAYFLTLRFHYIRDSRRLLSTLTRRNQRKST